MANLGYIQVIRLCNQKCRFCSNPENMKELPLGRAKKMVDRYRAKGYDGVILTGGEPTLYSGLPELIAYCRRRRVPCRVITNGQRTAEPDYLRGLVEAGLELIHVSVHSHRPKVQGYLSGNPDSLSNILRTLVLLRRHHIGVVINQTICRQNADHVDGAVRWFCRKFPYLRHFSWTYLDTWLERVDCHPDVIPTLRSTEASLMRAMRFLHRSGRTFRIEKVPLCYMGEFAHCSTETRAIVTRGERDIQFLDKRRYYRETTWRYGKAPVCGGCSLDNICAGLWDMGRRYDPGELRAQKRSPEPIIRAILGTSREGGVRPKPRTPRVRAR